MGKISQNERLESYYRIFEQIYENPVISICDISQNTGLARNTVTKYLKEMYAQGILHGPYLRMKPAVTYKEHVYLMNFTDPFCIFEELKRFPHVVHHAVTFGDWNTLVVTDNHLNFSQLEGFENVVKQGVRYCSYTPKPEYMNWNESFKKIYERVNRFTPVRTEYKDRRLTSLDWGEDQWKLYHTFNFMRKKITPLLRKINVGYDTYTKWMKSLKDYCTVHTGFYPEGLKPYMNYCFLFYTDYEESVKSVFSLFPTTSFITELDKQLLVFTYVKSSEVKRKLIYLIYDMETKQMIKGFRQAIILFHSRYTLSRIEEKYYYQEK